MDKNIMKINEEDLKQIVTESVKRVLKEGRSNETLQAAKNWGNLVQKWNSELMALKQKVWANNGNRNTPELELLFSAMRLLSNAETWFVNPYCNTLRQQNSNPYFNGDM